MPVPVVAYLGMLYSIVHAGFAAGASEEFENNHRQKLIAFEAFAGSAFGA